MPKVGRLAAEALQDLCQCCAVHMAAPAQLNGLLQIYTNMNGASGVVGGSCGLSSAWW